MTKHCLTCGKTYSIKPSAADKSSYCSRSCMATGYKTRMCGEANPNHRGTNKKTCELCGSEFESYIKGRRFCSKSCASKATSTSEVMSAKSRLRDGLFRLKRPAAPKKSRCAKCDAEIVGQRKYCKVCTKYGKCKYRQCAECGKRFKGHKKTCGKTCLSRWRAKIQSGENSHLWRGGKTTEAQIARGSTKYAEWRSSVFKRDHYTCAMCAMRGGKLSAHHIRPWSSHEELRYEVGNGITLCWPCHASIKGKEADYASTFLDKIGQVDVVASFEEAWAVIEREARKAGAL